MTTATKSQAQRPVTLADLADRERRRLRLCVHEASHSVIGTVFGGCLHTAVVGGGKVTGLQGTTLFDDLAIGQHPSVALAGPYGEARFVAGRRPTARELDAALAASGSKDRAVLTAAGVAVSDVSGELANLAERCWGAIIDVAKRLHRDGEVSHRDVCAALSIPTRNNGLHLSMIRSAAVPGTS